MPVVIRRPEVLALSYGCPVDHEVRLLSLRSSTWGNRSEWGLT
ncbi:MAG: hypothetical protein PVI78_09370 [Anaerolineales bacterium]